MGKLKWWFIVVGAFYLLLTVMNLYGIFFNQSLISSTFPFPVDENGLKAATNLWLAFILELGVIGVFLLWASRRPAENINLVWLVVWLEIIRGIVDDLYLISQGYDVVGYVVFILIHLAIIVTGILFARQARRQLSTA